jgi:hypothetical protein
MVRNGPTKGGGMWAQLTVSAGALLLAPLVLTAGVMVFGSSPRQDVEPRGAAQQFAVSQSTVTKSVPLAERPDGATGFALASVEPHPVITEQHAVAEQRSTTERHVSEQPSAAKDTSRYDTPVPITPREQPAARKDNSQYFGPTPVTLVHVRKSREQSAMADIEAARPTVTAAHASTAVPVRSRAATRIHASHSSRGMGEHEPRNVYRGKPRRARSLNEPRRLASVAAGTGGAPGGNVCDVSKATATVSTAGAVPRMVNGRRTVAGMFKRCDRGQ